MKRTIVLVAAVLVAATVQVAVAAKQLKDDTRREAKLVGAWKGQTACGGDFLFRADGTYELTRYGPGHSDSAGIWKVRWETTPPMLVLICKTSDCDDDVGTTTQLLVVQLEDAGLVVRGPSQSDRRFARLKK